MIKTFALVLGIAYLAAGVMGFIPGLVTPPTAGVDLAVGAGHGRLLGIFPVNVLHNVFHAGIGIWGLAAARNFISSVVFARGVAIIYGLLTVMGLIPGLATVFGLIPIYGSDVWLHLVTAAVSAYFGWGAPARVRNTVGA